MCEAGHPQWLFTDSEACYVGHDMRLRQCICPLTTCSLTDGIYGCHLTSSMMVITFFLFFIWIAAVCAYAYIGQSIASLTNSSTHPKEPTLTEHYYYHRLFGDPSPDTADILVH